MITAQEFERAAIASGRTMEELARLLGKTRSQIYTYRREGVSKPQTVETVRQRMGLWLRNEKGEPFEWFSDDELVRELSRRLSDLREVTRKGESSPNGASADEQEVTLSEPPEGAIDGTLGRRPRSDDEG